MKKRLSRFCTLEIEITYFREEPFAAGPSLGCAGWVWVSWAKLHLSSPVCSSQPDAPCRSVRSFCSVCTEPSHKGLWEDGEAAEGKESGSCVPLLCLASHGGLAPHQHHVRNHQWKTSIRPESPVCCESSSSQQLPALLLFKLH